MLLSQTGRSDAKLSYVIDRVAQNTLICIQAGKAVGRWGAAKRAGVPLYLQDLRP